MVKTLQFASSDVQFIAATLVSINFFIDRIQGMQDPISYIFCPLALRGERPVSPYTKIGTEVSRQKKDARFRTSFF